MPDSDPAPSVPPAQPGFGPPAPPRRPWGGAPAPVPPGPPGKPGSARKRALYGAVTALVFFAGVGIGAAGGGEDEGADGKTAADAGPRPTVTVTEAAGAEPAPTVTETVRATVTAKPKAKPKPAGPKATIPGDGEFLVGEDIQPGTYKTSGPDGFGCYWERAKDASGELTAIIANNNLEGPGRVTVNQGEYFKSRGCADWQKTG
ncbi:hypothetical protein ACFW9D_16140 [Streptomyces sp. NPDC059524]|uniref:hypothetical protein n=1 Tax=Streptomyces sp. NPDC059524 TaxID=3346856 RepID=UPI003686C388